MVAQWAMMGVQVNHVKRITYKLVLLIGASASIVWGMLFIQDSPLVEMKRDIYMQQLKDSDQPRQVIRVIDYVGPAAQFLGYACIAALAILTAQSEFKHWTAE
jgi:hypothetical protein